MERRKREREREKQVEVATAPWQHALAARAGCGSQRSLPSHVEDAMLQGLGDVHDIHLGSVYHPDRVGEIHSILQRELFRHAHVSIHLGKTKIWNRSGDARLQAAAVVVEQSTVVPVSSQGVKILGSPVGHPDDVSVQQVKSDSVLLDRIPAMEDTQTA